MKKIIVLICALVLTAGFSAQARVWQEGKCLKIGHRGTRALVDENTLESIKKAVEMGVDAVEFDIQRTKDGVYVIMHDETVDRTTNGSGRVDEMTLEEFQKLKTASGYTPPTLEAVLEYLKTTDVGIIMDIKCKKPDAIPDIYAIVERLGLSERVVYETSYPKVAKAIEEFNPELISAIYPAWPPSAFSYAKKYKLDCVSLYYPFANKLAVDKARKNGYKIVVWTVNKPKLIQKFRDDLKVDGIMTDDPGQFNAGTNDSCGCGK